MTKRQGPWAPAPYDPADARAIQDLEQGKATPEQQKRALKWIIESVSGTYDVTYWPGEDGERNTSFANGKRYVGLTIVKMLKLNPAEL